MSDLSCLFFSHALKALKHLTDNPASESWLSVLGEAINQIEGLVHYTLSEKQSILLQHKSSIEAEGLPIQIYRLSQGELTTEYGFNTPKSAEEIQRLSDFIFVILQLHQRYLHIQHQKQQEEIQTREALSDLRETQSALVEAEKMGALGGLVAGMAHELNTPLGIGVTALSTLQEEILLLQKSVETGTLSKNKMESTLQNMQDAGQLLKTHLNEAVLLIQNFKRVSPRQAYEAPQSIDLYEHLHQIINTLKQNTQYQSIDFQIQSQSQDSLCLYTYPNVWTQIINEWVSNSLLHGFKNTPSPLITLRLEPFEETPQKGMQALFNLMDHRLETDEGKGHLPLANKKHHQWRLIYNDNGSGIDEMIRPVIFEPFSTRSKSAFSGLGLYMVYNLVHQKLDGRIHAQASNPSHEGACFEIIFPHTEKSETNPL